MHRIVPGDHHKLVLADFSNSTGNPELDGSLKALLTFDLDESPSVLLASEIDLRSFLGKSLTAATPFSPERALSVCRASQNQAVIDGAIQKSGTGFRITLTAIDCTTGKPLTHVSATARTAADTLDAVDQSATALLRRFGYVVMPNSGSPHPHPYNLASLQLYSQAVTLTSKGHCPQAALLYERATQISPNFAAAFQSLSRCYYYMGEDEKSHFANVRANDLLETRHATRPICHHQRPQR